ncbi:phage portal protein [bacterium 1xD42-62]|uniref:Phage portal protein n=2 Tax=Parablautia muri TaxID=2320879 RepID=A0A9X5BHW1_9FIRM|nr:phage portal protein [Parablautia muri]
MKYKDIAQKYGVALNTVKSWKVRYGWEKNKSKSVHTKPEKVCAQNENKNGLQETVTNEEIQEPQPPGLTDKQRLFCCLYVKCFNATKAYQKAYEVDYFTAQSAGARMLRNVKVKKEIQNLKQNRLNREMLSEEDIFQKYMDIAFADITDYVEFGREIVPVMGTFGPVILKDEETGTKIEVKKEVNVIRLRESTEVDGTLISEVKQGKEGTSIKLADRMKALQWISDHMDLATDEQRARIAVLKSQVVQKDEAKGQAQDWKTAIIEIAKRRSKKKDGRPN